MLGEENQLLKQDILVDTLQTASCNSLEGLGNGVFLTNMIAKLYDFQITAVKLKKGSKSILYYNYLGVKQCLHRDGIIIFRAALGSILGKLQELCNFFAHKFSHLLKIKRNSETAIFAELLWKVMASF